MALTQEHAQVPDTDERPTKSSKSGIRAKLGATTFVVALVATGVLAATHDRSDGDPPDASVAVPAPQSGPVTDADTRFAGCVAALGGMPDAAEQRIDACAAVARSGEAASEECVAALGGMPDATEQRIDACAAVARSDGQVTGSARGPVVSRPDARDEAISTHVPVVASTTIGQALAASISNGSVNVAGSAVGARYVDCVGDVAGTPDTLEHWISGCAETATAASIDNSTSVRDHTGSADTLDRRFGPR